VSTGGGWSIGWRLKRLNVPLLLAGVGSLLAAAVPGLSFSGVTIDEAPVEARVGLALVGLGLVAASLFVGVERPALPLPVVSEEMIEKWRNSLRHTVLEKRFRGEESELHQMIRPGTVIDDLGAKERVDFRIEAQDRSRLQVRGRTVPWSELASEWDRAPGRMVILGQPGYGKTVAALMLVGHINTAGNPLERVAELFKLVEWHRWRAQHARERFADWLAYQLTETYEMPPDIARAIVDFDLLLPVLDGLDEVPAGERRDCKQAIDAYAGAAPPFRPFVLTCRAREYAELAPDWVAADRQIALMGLEADQVAAVLEERTSHLQQWKRIREEIAAGNPHLTRLFRSPLRLMIALQEYRTRDPTELLELDASAAEGRLWDLLLTRDDPPFDGARAEQIRAWLAFLARAMNKEGRQRLWLYELYLFVPAPETEHRRFAVELGLVYALAGALVVWLLAGVVGGLVAGVVGGLVFGGLVFGGLVFGGLAPLFAEPSVGVTVPWRARMQAVKEGTSSTLVGGLFGALVVWLIVGLIVGLAGELVVGLLCGLFGALVFGGLLGGLAPSFAEPSVGVTVPWRARMQAVKEGISSTLVVGVVAGLVIGVVAGLVVGLLVAGLVIGVAVGLTAALLGVVVHAVGAGTTVVAADPPPRLIGKGPNAVLIATRNNGLVAGVFGGMFGGVFGGVVTWVSVGLAGGVLGLNVLLAGGLAVGLFVALAIGLIFGGNSWLYHHWLRRRLARKQLLPRRLREFLDWCAQPQRGWLRVSDAYDFRHRGLLDHLARDRAPARLD
jgi:NACHT domain